jgi:hypothetical protein
MEVLTLDASTGTLVPAVVGELIVHSEDHWPHDFRSNPLVEVAIRQGGEVKTTMVTNNHEYLDPLTRRYVSIGKYAAGDKVVTAHGLGEIVSITTCIDGTNAFAQDFVEVYALNLSNGEKNYLVNGAVVESTERKELEENDRKSQILNAVQFGFSAEYFQAVR